mmetsp:Transcript_6795/g.8945  ORF Transcript_6795/g.8945 Transcript_6795/m.8945 type:complete len:917 (-) Transcript_6795:461-3211(-)
MAQETNQSSIKSDTSLVRSRDEAEMSSSRSSSQITDGKRTNKLYEDALRRIEKIEEIHEQHLDPQCTFRPLIGKSGSQKVRSPEEMNKTFERLSKHGAEKYAAGALKPPEQCPEETFRPKLNRRSSKMANERPRTSVDGKRASVYDSLYAEADRRLQRMEERLKSPDPTTPFTPNITKKARRLSVEDSKKRLLRTFSDLDANGVTAKEMRDKKLKEQEEKKQRESMKECTFKPTLYSRSKSANVARQSADCSEPAFLRLYAKRHSAADRTASLKQQQQEVEDREATFKPKIYTKRGGQTNPTPSPEPFHDRLYNRATRERGGTKAATIRQEMDKECTFKPRLRSKSGSQNNPGGSGTGSKVHERLYQQSLAQQVKIQERQAVKKEEDLSECTFQPNLDEARRSVSRKKSSRALREAMKTRKETEAQVQDPRGGEKIWDRLAHDKRETFRQREEAKIKAEEEACTFAPSLPDPNTSTGELRRLRSSSSMYSDSGSTSLPRRNSQSFMAPTQTSIAKSSLMQERDPFELRSNGSVNSPNTGMRRPSFSSPSTAGRRSRVSSNLSQGHRDIASSPQPSVENGTLGFDPECTEDPSNTPPPGPAKKTPSKKKAQKSPMSSPAKEKKLQGGSPSLHTASKRSNESASKPQAAVLPEPVVVDDPSQAPPQPPIVSSPIAVPPKSSSNPINTKIPEVSPVVRKDPEKNPAASLNKPKESSAKVPEPTSPSNTTSNPANKKVPASLSPDPNQVKLAARENIPEAVPRNATGEMAGAVPPKSSENPADVALRYTPPKAGQRTPATVPPKFDDFEELRDDWERKTSSRHSSHASLKDDGEIPKPAASKPAPEETNGSSAGGGDVDIVDRLKRMMNAIDTSNQKSDIAIKKSSSPSPGQDKPKVVPRKASNEPEKWVDNMANKIDNL